MKLRIIAVGTRMPDWVQQGFDDYARRLPRDCPLQLTEIRAENRTGGKSAAQLMALEAQRIEAALPARAYLVALDERGAALTTAALAERLEYWRTLGQDIVFLIGGADGLDAALKARAHETLRLSSLTLPHALVRPLLAEALYRAWTVTQNHPYHRA